MILIDMWGVAQVLLMVKLLISISKVGYWWVTQIPSIYMVGVLVDFGELGVGSRESVLGSFWVIFGQICG
jgi:hypothetical protein